MRLQFTLTGVSPILMHNGAAGIDTRNPLSREIAAIAAKKGGDRTDVEDLRLQELECRRSLYLDADGKPTLPEAALRAMIEASARKVKQGAQVREGLLIEWVSFCYDAERYGETLDKLVQTTQFTVPAVVSGKRIPRTRARFDCPWLVVGVADVDEELVDKTQLTAWLAVGGRRIGLGDWRPETKGGVFGRFDREARRRGRHRGATRHHRRRGRVDLESGRRTVPRRHRNRRHLPCQGASVRCRQGHLRRRHGLGRPVGQGPAGRVGRRAVRCDPDRPARPP